LGRQDRARNIEAENLCEPFRAYIKKALFGGVRHNVGIKKLVVRRGAGVVPSGPVYQDIAFAESVKYRVMRGQNAAFVRDVGRERFRDPALGSYLIGKLLPLFLTAVYYRDFSSAFSERPAEFAAEYSGASGDDGCFSGKI
jgi:hypothetical protein